MTRISLLEDQKAVFAAQFQELEDKWEDIYIAEQRAVNAVLTENFSGFDKDIVIEISGGSVYFKMAHPDYNYNKELFSIYLRESWRDEGQKYSGMDVSYYTTTTKADDTWEMKRLQLLGKVAEIVEKNHQTILTEANKAVLSFKDQYKPINEQQKLLRQAIKDLDERITVLEKEKIAFDLMNEGVKFTKEAYIQMKYNYTARVKNLKLVDISKSGKKATAVFESAYGGLINREENVSIERILEQVLGYKNIISEKELAV